MGKSRAEEFRKAYNYLRKRTPWMRYSEYKNRHIPLGSGITEAACKTIYTQRLKLSGMRWKPAGAQQILTLRTVASEPYLGYRLRPVARHEHSGDTHTLRRQATEKRSKLPHELAHQRDYTP